MGRKSEAHGIPKIETSFQSIVIALHYCLYYYMTYLVSFKTSLFLILQRIREQLTDTQIFFILIFFQLNLFFYTILLSIPLSFSFHLIKLLP